MQIPYHRPYITEDEVNAAAETIRNGWLTMGKKTIDFEESFASFVGMPHAVAVNSCTAALHLSLCAIDLKEGDEVIVPTTTFVSTAEVVRYFNARPVMVDIEKGTHCLDASKIERALTPRTKAVIPVHFGGQPCDMDEITAIAAARNIPVIEDAAHAFPASYKGRQIGTIGDMTCFSFYATKTITSGEGGMVVTRDGQKADRMRRLRLHGITKDAWKRYTKEGTWEYDVTEAGFKYNTTDVCSAIAIEQLKKAQWMTDRRFETAARYDAAFAGYAQIIPYEIKGDRVSARHLYPLRLNLDALTIDRSAFIRLLNEKGVMTSVHFIPMYRFTYYKSLGYRAADYPASDWVYERMISLPLYPGMTDEETNYVIETVIEICRAHTR
ncbi:MAG: DegT/DnrJ/EryC1/StrS family aminotransferase [Spirochaetota bacterium]